MTQSSPAPDAAAGTRLLSPKSGAGLSQAKTVSQHLLAVTTPSVTTMKYVSSSSWGGDKGIFFPRKAGVRLSPWFGTKWHQGDSH